MGYTTGHTPSQRQLQQLLRAFFDQLREDPDDLHVRLKLAETLRLLGRIDEAVRAYSAVAWEHALAGNLVQAIMLCKLILEINPQHRKTQQTLARLYASKRIRDDKQALPVERLGDKWVVDPRPPRPAAAAPALPPPHHGPPPSAADGVGAAKDAVGAAKDAVGAAKDAVGAVSADRTAPLDDDLPPLFDDSSRSDDIGPTTPPRRPTEKTRLGKHSSQNVEAVTPRRPIPLVVDAPPAAEAGPEVVAPRAATAGRGDQRDRQDDRVDPFSRTDLVQVEDAAPVVGKLPSLPPMSDDDQPETQVEPEPDAEAPSSAPPAARETARLPLLSTDESSDEWDRLVETWRDPEKQPGATTEGNDTLRDDHPGDDHPGDDHPPAANPPMRDTALLGQPSLFTSAIPTEHNRAIDPAAAAGPEHRAQPDHRLDAPDAPDAPAADEVSATQRPADPAQTTTAKRRRQTRELFKLRRAESPGEADRATAPVPNARPRHTVPLGQQMLDNLLRKDAELAYLHGERITQTYEAIRREVAREGHEQADEELSADQLAKNEEALRDTLRDPPESDGRLDPDAIGRIPLFAGLDPSAFVALIDRLQRRLYRAGELVLSEGQPGDSLLLVATGRLVVLKRDDGELIELGELGPGAFFGEFALLTDQRRHASVRCLEDCEILELRREVLAELIREHPSIAETLRAAYEQRVVGMVMATCALFQAVGPEDRLRVVRRFSTVRRGPDEIVVQQGGESSHFFVILVGEVSVTCRDDAGKEIEVGRLTEGDYFGEMALISGYRAEATVRTVRTTELLALEDRDFYELASTHPEIWAEIQRASETRKAINARLLASRKAEALLL